MKLGAVPIPTNILMKAPDFLYVLNDSRAPVLIVDAAFLPEIKKIRSDALFLKHVVVCGGSGPGCMDFDALLSTADPAFQAALTTCDDAAFWLYSGRNPRNSWPPSTITATWYTARRPMPRASSE